MRRRILSTFLASAIPLVVSPGVHAADLPVKAPPPVAAPPAWTGFYVGANAGYGAGIGAAGLAPLGPGFVGTFASGFVPSAASVKSHGYPLGEQIGYNYQLGQFVLGAEADFQYALIRGGSTITEFPIGIGPPTGVTNVQQTMDWFATARARAGILVSAPLLVYATGGFALGRVEDSASFFFPGTSQYYAGSGATTKSGWTAGGGVEWAVAARWTVKGEYLYYDLGDAKVTIQPVSGITATATADFPINGSLIRAGLNYHF